MEGLEVEEKSAKPNDYKKRLFLKKKKGAALPGCKAVTTSCQAPKNTLNTDALAIGFSKVKK